MNYMVAMCDILGFTELVQKNPLDVVVQSSLEWLRKPLHHSMYKDGFPTNTPSLGQLQVHSQLGIAWFSDTILIYTLNDTDTCFNALTSTLGWLLFETMLVPHARLRCGVSYGEAYVDADNAVYVGRPLIEAHHLEECQAWSGGALTPIAVQRLPEEGRTGQFVANWFLTPYKVPFTDGTWLDTLAIDWTVGCHHPWDVQFPWSETTEQPTEKDWEERPDVCQKWQNTRAFHSSVCRFCK